MPAQEKSYQDRIKPPSTSESLDFDVVIFCSGPRGSFSVHTVFKLLSLPIYRRCCREGSEVVARISLGTVIDPIGPIVFCLP